MLIPMHASIKSQYAYLSGEQVNVLKFWAAIHLRFRLCFIILFRNYYVEIGESTGLLEPQDISLTRWILGIYGKGHIPLFHNKLSQIQQKKQDLKFLRTSGILK